MHISFKLEDEINLRPVKNDGKRPVQKLMLIKLMIIYEIG